MRETGPEAAPKHPPNGQHRGPVSPRWPRTYHPFETDNSRWIGRGNGWLGPSKGAAISPSPRSTRQLSDSKGAPPVSVGRTDCTMASNTLGTPAITWTFSKRKPRGLTDRDCQSTWRGTGCGPCAGGRGSGPTLAPYNAPAKMAWASSRMSIVSPRACAIHSAVMSS